MQLEGNTEAFWRGFLKASLDPDDKAARFYETFRIGNTPGSADEGAALIKRKLKTATSSLLWAFQHTNKPLPKVGSLSIVTDAQANPVCVVETVEVQIREFREVDVRFAEDYGEWDCSLESWKTFCWRHYSEECRSLGREMNEHSPLVCERFRVVYPP